MLTSGSKAVGLMLAFCSKMAQHMGVAKVRTTPNITIWGYRGNEWKGVEGKEHGNFPGGAEAGRN